MGNVIMKAQQITYGASNVEKALDDLKAPELIELNKRMDAIDAWKANVHEETYTGSELTIENALALPARSLITSINAIQPLHGYDHPWAGGAEKNKLPNNYTGTGTAGVTAVNNSDGSIKLNGTASTTGYILLNRFEADAFKDIPLKISINGVSGLHLYVNGVDANNRFVASVGATISETTITPTYSNYVKLEVGLQLDNGTTFNGTFYPMIRLASESDASWQPYSNICPISGRTEARVDTENEDSTESAYAVIQLGTTVYGADINWDTGVMTVKTALVTLNGTEDWNVETTTQSGVYRYSLADGIDNIKLPINNNTPLECNSNMYVGITANESYVASKYGISNLSLNSDKLVVIDETYHTNDATAWKAYLANNPLQIEYVLATPTTLQLTPSQLQMLKGYNRVTLADGYGEIELKALVLGGDN